MTNRHPCLCDICLKARDAEVKLVRDQKWDKIEDGSIEIMRLQGLLNKKDAEKIDTIDQTTRQTLYVRVDRVFNTLLKRMARQSEKEK